MQLYQTSQGKNEPIHLVCLYAAIRLLRALPLILFLALFAQALNVKPDNSHLYPQTRHSTQSRYHLMIL